MCLYEPKRSFGSCKKIGLDKYSHEDLQFLIKLCVQNPKLTPPLKRWAILKKNLKCIKFGFWMTKLWPFKSWTAKLKMQIVKGEPIEHETEFDSQMIVERKEKYPRRWSWGC